MAALSVCCCVLGMVERFHLCLFLLHWGYVVCCLDGGMGVAFLFSSREICLMQQCLFLSVGFRLSCEVIVDFVNISHSMKVGVCLRSGVMITPAQMLCEGDFEIKFSLYLDM